MQLQLVLANRDEYVKLVNVALGFQTFLDKDVDYAIPICSAYRFGP
jgi:hypothetical protein